MAHAVARSGTEWYEVDVAVRQAQSPPRGGFFFGEDAMRGEDFADCFSAESRLRKEKWRQHLTFTESPGIVGGCRPKATVSS